MLGTADRRSAKLTNHQNVMMAANQNQNLLLEVLNLLSRPLRKILQEVHFLELFYIRLYNIYAFVSQIIFFVLCAFIFDEFQEIDNQKERYLLMALKTLLFYSVFTYFVSKTRDIWLTSQTLHIYQRSFFEGLSKIILEWAKAIIVVLCLREQGIYFNPKIVYAIVTSTYYLCTEKIYLELFQSVAQVMDLEYFENLEHLYLPLFFNIYALALSCIFELYIFANGEHFRFFVLALYLIVYLRVKDSYFNYWKKISHEKLTFESFRKATARELEDYDDVCAVCLNKMSKAKITPCNHYFHPGCLKECLKTSFLCPICKLNF